MFPTVTIQAAGTIFNGEYFLPSTGLSDSDHPLIVETCKLTLDRLGVAVLFDRDTITTFVEDEKELREGRYGWLDHLVNFIIYKSRVSYRLYCNWFTDNVTSFASCSEVDRVIEFNLERLTGEQGIKEVEGRYVALGLEPVQMAIERKEFDSFHKLIDRDLALAIAYFLIASENPKYFLVEYYKCVEVIKQALGGEKAMIKALSSYGFSGRKLKKLTSSANAQLMPIGFGRHAPKKNANVIGINLRALHNPTIHGNSSLNQPSFAGVALMPTCPFYARRHRAPPGHPATLRKYLPALFFPPSPPIRFAGSKRHLTKR